ncbi:Glucuronosyltransferase [Aphelenchoides bicaudatus]|nr:Glucuronosyltransferase [Aphelenchoides bicaudatus]
MQNYGGLPYLFGIPQPYVSSPEVFDLSFQTFPTFDHSNILRRTFEFLNRLRIDFVVTPHSWIDEDQLFQQRFENFPSLAELYARSSYVFLGTNPLLDRPRAITSKIKYIGGKHRDGIEPLSEEYTKLLNDKKGGVLFSLGAFSNTSHFPQEIKRSIGRAFARFPDYVFFWKYSDLSDDAEFFSNITNIYRSTWLPQYELLHHSKLHIAITHVGQNSYYEISKAGKPMIAIPLFADQYYNTACGLRNGVAYHVDKTQLSEDTIFKALKEVIENPSYTKRAELIGQAINADPHVGSQEFVLWSEYAAKFPQLSDMQTLETAQMNLFKYLSLDKMKNNAESVSTMAPEVPLLHWRSYRLYLLFILMIVFGVSSCNYMNMGITLTCMVDAQFYEKNNVIAHSEECPNYAENRTELGYKGTLQWTPLQQSQIFAVFFWTNLFTMWCSGALSDRFNAKYLVTAAVSTYAILSLISPLLVSFHYYAFLASRALMGIAESFVFPCMTSIVAHWIPPNERSTAAAIYTSGHQLASLVAVLISSKLCLIDWLNGWPLVFYFFGVCGVFATVLFVTLISNRPEESRLISQKELNYVHEQLLKRGPKEETRKEDASSLAFNIYFQSCSRNYGFGV